MQHATTVSDSARVPEARKLELNMDVSLSVSRHRTTLKNLLTRLGLQVSLFHWAEKSGVRLQYMSRIWATHLPDRIPGSVPAAERILHPYERT